jgi:surface polysaccharide O-acyltransferase-like enzyme
MKDENQGPLNAQTNTSLAHREIWMDALKIAACMGVVLAHSVYSYNSTDNESRWFLSLCLNALARFGFPCFMMISSVLILRQAEDIRKIWRVRIPKLAVTLTFWGVAYILFKKFAAGEELTVAAEILTIPFGHKDAHLWYNYYLIALYLISPMLVVFHKHSAKEQRYTVVGVFLMGKALLDMLLKIIHAPVGGLVVTGWNKFGIMELIFSLLAFMVYDACVSGKINKLAAAAGVFIGYWLMILASGIVYYQQKSPSQDFLSHVSFPAMIFGASVFALFYSYKDKFANLSARKREAIAAISKLTMGVYFIHPMIQSLSRKVFDMIYHDMMGRSYSWDILVRYPLTDFVFMLGVFALSLTVCFGLSKIPYLRRVIL